MKKLKKLKNAFKKRFFTPYIMLRFQLFVERLKTLKRVKMEFYMAFLSLMDYKSFQLIQIILNY